MRAEGDNAPWLLALPGQEVWDRPEPGCDWLIDRVRPADPAVRRELEARGFVFLDAQAAASRRGTLRAAAEAIGCVPSLDSCVRHAVGAITLLDADPCYDVSHSEPRWPADIFVSVCSSEGQVSALRAAENIIHEAMHLQLTTLESVEPLVADETCRLPSPWRDEPRPLQGVLHGLYVFRCIQGFLGAQALWDRLNDTGRAYSVRRLQQTGAELAQIDRSALEHGLTLAGRRFLFRLAWPDEGVE